MSETDTADIATQEMESIPALPNPSQVAEPELLSFVQSAFDQFSLENLSLLEDNIREKRTAKQNEVRFTARQKIEEQIKHAGMSLPDLIDLFPELLPAAAARKGGGSPLPPKYRGPNGEVWSGRGHEPKWITASGRKKEEFLIEQDAGSALPVPTEGPGSGAATEGPGSPGEGPA